MEDKSVSKTLSRGHIPAGASLTLMVEDVRLWKSALLATLPSSPSLLSVPLCAEKTAQWFSIALQISTAGPQFYQSVSSWCFPPTQCGREILSYWHEWSDRRRQSPRTSGICFCRSRTTGPGTRCWGSVSQASHMCPARVRLCEYRRLKPDLFLFLRRWPGTSHKYTKTMFDPNERKGQGTQLSLGGWEGSSGFGDLKEMQWWEKDFYKRAFRGEWTGVERHREERKPSAVRLWDGGGLQCLPCQCPGWRAAHTGSLHWRVCSLYDSTLSLSGFFFFWLMTEAQ